MIYGTEEWAQYELELQRLKINYDERHRFEMARINGNMAWSKAAMVASFGAMGMIFISWLTGQMWLMPLAWSLIVMSVGISLVQAIRMWKMKREPDYHKAFLREVTRLMSKWASYER